MPDPKHPQPLEYADLGRERRGPSGGALVVSILCLIAGIPMTSLGLAAAIKYYVEVGDVAVFAPASLIAGAGIVLCALGMWLKRKKPHVPPH